jgi:L-glutamine:2-deoxy-scyllo-inosose/3-amino-2,3-dideoxy-scyllo-inosose aminotransferase
MRTHSKSAEKLAILGGAPVTKSLTVTPWPPTNKTTERALVGIYRSHKFSWNGPWEQKFCREFSKAHTAKHTIFMANGTVTLEAALHVLGVGPGDEVIVPGLTWPATAMAAIYMGAKPVFVDIEPDTLCLDPEKVEEAITPRTKAIIPVHLYGGMADMDRIMAIARKHKLKVVEDCAHAHGGMWNGRGLGSIGDAGSFSFQQSKTVASGEGGAVITNNSRLHEPLFRFKHIGYDLEADQGKATSGPPAGLTCHNYRGTEFPAAILCGQLPNLKSLTVQRNRNADFLTSELEKLPGLRVQARGRKATEDRQSYYAFMTLLDLTHWGNATYKQVIKALQKEGIPASGSYGTVYRHLLWNASKSEYRIHGSYRDKRGPACKVSEEVGTDRCVGFPHYYLDLSRTDLQKFVDAFAKVQRNAGQLKKI